MSPSRASESRRTRARSLMRMKPRWSPDRNASVACTENGSDHSPCWIPISASDCRKPGVSTACMTVAPGSVVPNARWCVRFAPQNGDCRWSQQPGGWTNALGRTLPTRCGKRPAVEMDRRSGHEPTEVRRQEQHRRRGVPRGAPDRPRLGMCRGFGGVATERPRRHRTGRRRPASGSCPERTQFTRIRRSANSSDSVFDRFSTAAFIAE